MTRTPRPLPALATEPPLDEVVRGFPAILDGLRRSYGELEARAELVEQELFRANRELENKVVELDGLKRHLEAVLESLPCGVVVRDAEGEIVEVNAAAQEIFARARGGEAGELPDLLHGERADGEPREIPCQGGRRLVLASSYSPVRRRDGSIEGSVQILDDQTERAEMTERLHATDKMAALGTMAAGIAHEIRNPLNAVKGFAALLVKRPDLDAKASRWCGLIVDAAAEADTIIENMLSFGSPRKLRLEGIEPAELVETAASLARSESAEDAVIEIHADAPRFLGDKIKLRQMLRNLIANALVAQRAGDPERTARVAVRIERDGDWITLRVDDAGPGIPAETRRRIFDPFYTEHPDGTGLGLALVSTIVRLHEGSVRISGEPSPLGGAAFLVRIPFRPADTSAAPASSQEC